jgi:hypothetical protein
VTRLANFCLMGDCLLWPVFCNYNKNSVLILRTNGTGKLV